MEAIHDPGHSSVSWVARLVEVLQPLSLRADRLAAMELFAGLRWADLEFAADLLRKTDVDQGTRMTIQGRPGSRLWVIMQGEALVSANAHCARAITRRNWDRIHAAGRRFAGDHDRAEPDSRSNRGIG